jgi:hypothetical protein
LSHPGDRRRVVFWAKERGHTIVTNLEEQVDVLLLSERSDLGKYAKGNSSVPIVFDLIDGYLARQNPINDWLRGASKVFSGQLTGNLKSFSSFVQNLCKSSAAVVCSSVEQLNTISRFSNNVHVILDSHDELPLLPFRRQESRTVPRVLWEGMPATLGGIKTINSALTNVQQSIGLELDIVTDPTYYKVLGKFIQSDTEILVKQNLGDMYPFSNFSPWSLETLIEESNYSHAALIPINLSQPLQNLKPENRLLIMWRLGLPCITSSSPAYLRTTAIAGVDSCCRDLKDWQTKLERVLCYDELAETMVSKGQAYLREFHNRELLLSKWDKVFESVF